MRATAPTLALPSPKAPVLVLGGDAVRPSTEHRGPRCGRRNRNLGDAAAIRNTQFPHAPPQTIDRRPSARFGLWTEIQGLFSESREPRAESREPRAETPWLLRSAFRVPRSAFRVPHGLLRPPRHAIRLDRARESAGATAKASGGWLRCLVVFLLAS
jgi:hypothetical protein